jgi:alpha-galactosidase
MRELFLAPAILTLAPAILALGVACDADSFAAPPEVDDDLPLPLAAGLAPVPPMGWNSWNKFSCNVSAALIRQTADAMVATGMREAGYRYINIDDCWHNTARAADGSQQPTANFPEGIKGVADYVHGLGLKLGIYSDRGLLTCGGKAGSEGYEQIDAMAYAAWGVDYLKHDNCRSCPSADRTDCTPMLGPEPQYRLMGDALRGSGRDIVYSLCAWSFYEWGVGLGHLWRTTSDIRDRWTSITTNITINQQWAAYAGPNGWNDPDMLEVGVSGGMTVTEYRAHFTMWAMMAAPLLAGNDLRTLNDGSNAEIKTILLNEEIIAIDQDPLGYQGVPVRTEGDLWVWAKPLNASGARAVALLNKSEAAADITVTFAEIGLGSGGAKVRDLWDHADRGTFRERFTANVPSHGVVALRIVGSEPRRPSGTAYLSDLDHIYAANGIGPIEKDRSNGATAAGDGVPLSLGGTVFPKGLGVAAPSAVVYRLAKGCSRFRATAGLDDSTTMRGSAVFQVWADGELLWDSGPVTGAGPPVPVDVDVTGKQRLKLFVRNAGDGEAWDLATWGDARVECSD